MSTAPTGASALVETIERTRTELDEALAEPDLVRPTGAATPR